MNASISMDGLWAVIDSLSIRNKKWIANKLNASLNDEQSTHEKEILSGIARSVKEAREGKTFSMDTLWDQL